jgi:adenylate cyclase
MAAIRRLNRDLTGWIGNLPPVAHGKLWPRVGGHYGPVILSRLGAADHQHISATGDTVNVASRLLEVSKQHRMPIAVSEDLYRAASLPGTPAEQGLGEAMEIEIRGRAHPLSVRVGNAAVGTA